MSTWWKEAVIYQIYPRSFQDSNGDGIGDIPGIISRLDEIKDLGTGVIWLSPVYKSPQTDNGYDISDYRDIDPIFGTMADMDNLIAEAKKRGIRIIMDLVINHTSDEHEWFQKSRDKSSPYRDYYIWQPPKTGRGGKRKPPNNWTSFFAGEVWEFDESSGEYYLHLFHKKQPDLNYKNPKVLEEIKGILKFWLDKGIAGFRCDVINVIYKTSLSNGKPSLIVRGLEHYKSQEGNHEILRVLRHEVLDKYDCFTVGETAMVDLDDAKLLCDSARGELDMLFYFDHLEVDRRLARFVPKKFEASKLLAVINKWQRGLEWNAVYFENHDQPRIVSHYGDDRPLYWAMSAKLLATLEFTLRGTPFVYQGQEIGMTNFDFTSLAQVQDTESHSIDALMRRFGFPTWLRWGLLRVSSRDNARTPVQWSAGQGAGFTTGSPWLGINANYTRINVEAQQNDSASVLNYYKRMIALRAGSDTLKYGDFTPLYGGEKVIVYSRSLGDEKYTVALNFSKKPSRIRCFAGSSHGSVVISNTDRTEMTDTLSPWEAVVTAKKSKFTK